MSFPEFDARRVNYTAAMHLPDIPNFGEKTLEEVLCALERIGFVCRDRKEAADGRAKELKRKQTKPYQLRKLPGL